MPVLARQCYLAPVLLASTLLAACGSPEGVPGSGESLAGRADTSPRQTKSLTLGIVGNVQAFGFAATGNTPAGGWGTSSEVQPNGLVTAEPQSRKPIGLVAASVPSFEDGTIALLPDGRAHVTYRLRKEVTWQDGVPLTAHDLVFSHRAAADASLPYDTQPRQVAGLIETTEAPDDHTFLITFRQPFYQAATLGLRPFWPFPRHILEEAYDRYQATGGSDEFLNLPYWTSQYVHLGPFRLTVFDPGEGLTFVAYDGYFRGRPKLDVVRFRFMANPNTLFSNLLAGSVDMFLDATLSTELEAQLVERWRATGEGTVFPISGEGGRFLMPQYRLDFQVEPAVLDPRVRAAFYHAIDRDAFAEAAELPILPMMYDASALGAGKSIRAFDDLAGGGGAGVPYGLYTRNAHLWDRL